MTGNAKPELADFGAAIFLAGWVAVVFRGLVILLA
jgi:hypothetical protein